MTIICKECLKPFDTFGKLSAHIKTHRMTSKEYYDKHLKKEGEGICPVCGKCTKFDNLVSGYRKYCGRSCPGKDMDPEAIKKRLEAGKLGMKTKIEKYGSPVSEESKAKMKNTQIERYGGIGFASKELAEKTRNTCKEKFGIENPSTLDIIKEKIANKKIEKYGTPNYNNTEAIKATMLKRYGKENASQVASIQEKIKSTNRERYGVDWGLSSSEIRDKGKNTLMSKYGTDNYSSTDEFKSKFLDEFLTKYDINHEILKKENRVVFCRCHKCNSLFERNCQSFVKRALMKEDQCPICNPLSNISGKEKEVCSFIESVYSGKIEKNTRKELEGNSELDIYIPDKKIAIEFDGLFWHSELQRDKNYHLRKTELCNKHGIRLIHIFEDEWNYKKDIVKSRIKSIIGKSKNKIYARKCALVELNSKEERAFFEKNHIQGYCPSKKCYGLTLNDKIVAAMSFGKSRFSKNEYELLRYASILDSTVIGGASKLFKHFRIENPEIKSISSYADRRWSNGTLYEKLGFKLVEKSSPSYFYVNRNIRENRLKYQKHKLVKAGADPKLTEHQIMFSKGLYRIYDCGTLKYRFEF